MATGNTISVTFGRGYDLLDSQTVLGPSIFPSYADLIVAHSNGDYWIDSTNTMDHTRLFVRGANNLPVLIYYSSGGYNFDFSNHDGSVNITGGDFSDVMRGGYGNDSLTGGGGNDILEGNLGQNNIDGGAGNNTVSYANYVSYSNDGIGLAVNLEYESADSYEFAVEIIDDNLLNIQNIVGSRYADTLYGTGQRNIFEGGRGGDYINGGGGNDLASYKTSVEAVIIDLFVGQASGGDAQGDTLIGIRDLLGGAGNDHLTGDTNDNILDGYLGADTLVGAAGNDTYLVDNTGDVVFEVDVGGFNYGNDTVLTSVGYTLSERQSIEALRAVNSAVDADFDLTGNALDQKVYGNAGNNVLDGKGGADIMQGYGGDDTYVVDDAKDRVIEAAGGGANDTVQVDTSNGLASYALSNGIGVEVLRAKDAAGLTTLALYGNNSANDLIGNDGANILDGRAGADTMKGLGGNDTYYVDDEHDVVIEAADSGTDQIYASKSVTLISTSEVETVRLLSSTGATALALSGSDSKNTLIGNAGDNRIDGGLGSDVLQGLGGADTFVFSTALDGEKNIDSIKDFKVGTDKIELDADVFGALSGGFSVDAFKVTSAKGATIDADDRILYDKMTGTLSYDADGVGGVDAIQFATLANKVGLTFADLLVA